MNAEWEDKVWGRVMHVFSSPHAAVSLLETNKGFRCSLHHHVHRINQFTVTEGIILVEEYEKLPVDNKEFILVDRIRLDQGDVHIVQAGVWHLFRVLESGSIVENYWSQNGGEVSISDIVRADIGREDEKEWTIL